MKSNHVSIHAWVDGTVQGVYFRDHTRKQAQALQLTGWVRNLADGRVEVVACGPREIIMEFIDWLWQGSPSAKVSDVCWEEISQQTFTEFTIR